MTELKQPGFDITSFLEKAGLGRRIVQLKPKRAFFSQGAHWRGSRRYGGWNADDHWHPSLLLDSVFRCSDYGTFVLDLLPNHGSSLQMADPGSICLRDYGVPGAPRLDRSRSSDLHSAYRMDQRIHRCSGR